MDLWLEKTIEDALEYGRCYRRNNIEEVVALNPCRRNLLEIAKVQFERGHNEEAKTWYQKYQHLAIDYFKVIGDFDQKQGETYEVIDFLINLGAFQEAWQHLECFTQFCIQTYKATKTDVYPCEIKNLFISLLNSSTPRWEGQTLGKHSTLLLHSNSAIDGLGDIILWLRFLPQIVSKDVNVILAIPHSLRGIAAQLDVTLWNRQQSSFKADYYLPLNLLPLRLNITRDTLPTEPYITPDSISVNFWQQHIVRFPGLKVGLVWRASENRRTVDLHEIGRLLSIPDITFFSLQKHEKAASDLRVLRNFGEITDLSPGLSDFSQTAAAITALDFVITVDTSTANLCGALGRSDWVMLPYCWDFRWSTKWYSSMHLFRQSAERSWTPVIDKVIEQLTKINIPKLKHERANNKN